MYRSLPIEITKRFFKKPNYCNIFLTSLDSPKYVKAFLKEISTRYLQREVKRAYFFKENILLENQIKLLECTKT